jgi:hypothetical protein
MSAQDLSGSWTYRWLNPTSGNVTPEEEALIRADAVLTLRSSAQAGNLEGTYEWQDGTLVLSGTFESGPEIFDYARFNIVGTGRPNTNTAGWEYRYHGHLLWQWAKGPEVQTPTLVGSVIRVNAHPSSDGGTSPAGEVFSFIALKQEQPVGPGAWSLPQILMGSWIYRSFNNNPKYPYITTPLTDTDLFCRRASSSSKFQPTRPRCKGRRPLCQAVSPEGRLSCQAGSFTSTLAGSGRPKTPQSSRSVAPGVRRAILPAGHTITTGI